VSEHERSEPVPEQPPHLEVSKLNFEVLDNFGRGGGETPPPPPLPLRSAPGGSAASAVFEGCPVPPGAPAGGQLISETWKFVEKGLFFSVKLAFSIYPLLE